jgi:hypothetical protein
MRAISLQSLIAAQQSKGETVQELSSPKRGVFAQKQKSVVPSKVPNSVFALGGV